VTEVHVTQDAESSQVVGDKYLEMYYSLLANSGVTVVFDNRRSDDGGC